MNAKKWTLFSNKIKGGYVKNILLIFPNVA